MKSNEIILTSADLEPPWFEDIENTKQIESIADRINASFGNDYLVSSGNSFAWVLKTLEKKYQKDSNIEYLPLSGRFYMQFDDHRLDNSLGRAANREFKVASEPANQRT